LVQPVTDAILDQRRALLIPGLVVRQEPDALKNRRLAFRPTPKTS
jgi:hypothetical protein